MKILFCCHGNICRSPMAEFVMKKLADEAGRDDLHVESAALHTDEIGNDIHPGKRGDQRRGSQQGAEGGDIAFCLQADEGAPVQAACS